MYNMVLTFSYVYYYYYNLGIILESVNIYVVFVGFDLWPVFALSCLLLIDIVTIGSTMYVLISVSSICSKLSVLIDISVLALAYGSTMSDLVFVGMVGLIDPPRDGIREAVMTLLSTGTHLKMVTGDAEETALAIGELPLFCFHVAFPCSQTGI